MINTGIQFVMLTLNYPAGALADRFHPIRIMLCMMGCLLFVVPLNFVWMFGSFPPDRVFHLSLLGYAADLPANLTILISLMALDLPITLLLGAVGMPLMMRLLPREEFGQFCSFNALVSAIMNILASLSVAWFMTGMRNLLPDAVWGKDFCYRMIPAWRLPFLALATLFSGCFSGSGSARAEKNTTRPRASPKVIQASTPRPLRVDLRSEQNKIPADHLRPSFLFHFRNIRSELSFSGDWQNGLVGQGNRNPPVAGSDRFQRVTNPVRQGRNRRRIPILKTVSQAIRRLPKPDSEPATNKRERFK